jgi:hypothetical protein
MEVNLSPETEATLRDLATRRGRTPDDLLQDAVAGYLDELANTREMLDQRYDQLEREEVELINGADALARLRGEKRVTE